MKFLGLLKRVDVPSFRANPRLLALILCFLLSRRKYSSVKRIRIKRSERWGARRIQ